MSRGSVRLVIAMDGIEEERENAYQGQLRVGFGEPRVGSEEWLGMKTQDQPIQQRDQ